MDSARIDFLWAARSLANAKSVMLCAQTCVRESRELLRRIARHNRNRAAGQGLDDGDRHSFPELFDQESKTWSP